MPRSMLLIPCLVTLLWCANAARPLLLAAAFAAAPQVTSAPPEIRELIEAFVTAVNGSPAEWEAMAKTRFSADFLSRQPADARAKLHQQLKKEFGTVTRDRVMRRGPDEPLELNVKGSTGATGVIRLSIEDAVPYRITGIDVEAGSGEKRTDEPPPAPINPSMTDAQLVQALDAYLSKLTANDAFSGVALVAKDGRTVFERAYGFADRANRIANTPGTRFNIGSVNKTFTQLAVAQLVAQGKLAYSDTLGTFFPDYPQAESRAATVQQLLNHTAGLADFFGEEFARTSKDRFRSNADYFGLVSRLPPLFRPGARNQYCNGCYIALGAIIERAAGVAYERYVHENIFTRAGMTGAGYPQSDAIEALVAMGYTRRGTDSVLRSNVFLHGAAGSAAGGGYATARDLLAYTIALREGRFGGAAASSTGNMGIAGGAPGTSAVLESDGVWTVAVLTNLDPPTGEDIGIGIMRALARGK
jgi:CubicO group peptidase (beta-lactamase class C family)